VHLFSNGGSLEFVDVCTLYKKATGKVLDVKAVVLDSAPGFPRLKEGWTAMSMSLPKGIWWYPGAAVILAMLGYGVVAKTVFGQKPIVEKTREWLNDRTIVNRTAKRLYVYSEADALVAWQDVESHADEAEKDGVEVSSLKFVDTPHVQHAFLESERYWHRVEELWKSTGS
jgi:hypothetical protein